MHNCVISYSNMTYRIVDTKLTMTLNMHIFRWQRNNNSMILHVARHNLFAGISIM